MKKIHKIVLSLLSFLLLFGIFALPVLASESSEDYVYEDNRFYEYVLITPDSPLPRSWTPGWNRINGYWYFFDHNGFRRGGWLLDGGDWFYLNPRTGRMYTGWVQVNGHWFWMDSGGRMQDGWRRSGGNYFFLNPARLQPGHRSDRPHGAMHVGWSWATISSVNSNVDRFFFLPEGQMVTGWHYVPHHSDPSAPMRYWNFASSGRWQANLGRDWYAERGWFYPLRNVNSRRISDGFRNVRDHNGIDIVREGAAAGVIRGERVYAAHAGVVRHSNFSLGTGPGHWIMIESNDVSPTTGIQLRTRYLHLSTRAVSANDTVTRGQFIGTVGNTGAETTSSAHLHIDVNRWGDGLQGLSAARAMNPQRFFPHINFTGYTTNVGMHE